MIGFDSSVPPGVDPIRSGSDCDGVPRHWPGPELGNAAP